MSESRRGILSVWRRLRSRAQISSIKPQEQLLFFPTVGRRARNGRGWELPVHGWIFELRKHPTLGRLLQTLVAEEWQRLTEDERSRFVERARFFFTHTRRGKRIVIQIGSSSCRLKPSAPNGHFRGRLRLKDEAAAQLCHDSAGKALQVRALTREGDNRVFEGRIELPGETGLSVISDIDDTIKITEAGHGREMLLNTFCREFRPVPGMAALYKHWAVEAGAAFHYVSSSPWQLYPFFADFIAAHGFPPGTFHLKRIRWTDGTFLRLLEPPVLHKRPVIERLLKAFPRRRFILVGDSGEKDPEIYGALARKFPGQIKQILIRESGGSSLDGVRYQRAFQELSEALWQTFKEPEEKLGDCLKNGFASDSQARGCQARRDE